MRLDSNAGNPSPLQDYVVHSDDIEFVPQLPASKSDEDHTHLFRLLAARWSRPMNGYLSREWRDDFKKLGRAMNIAVDELVIEEGVSAF